MDVDKLRMLLRSVQVRKGPLDFTKDGFVRVRNIAFDYTLEKIINSTSVQYIIAGVLREDLTRRGIKWVYEPYSGTDLEVHLETWINGYDMLRQQFTNRNR